MVTWKCCSNWSLGGFLVFERQRNQLNIQLGYLEAKKCLGIYQGNWYTFETAKPAERYWRRFLRFLVETLDLDVSFFTKKNSGGTCVMYIKTGSQVKHADWRCLSY
ncbi:hypothetical protein SNF32_08635 [Enterococcus mundtii]|nr:hypothetical protein [Enterococcus mundtii]